jgi:hypothetical protein
MAHLFGRNRCWLECRDDIVRFAAVYRSAVTPPQTARTRIEALTAEAIREVGVLFVAFAPLDTVFAPSAPGTFAVALLFLLVGLPLFLIGLRMESTG